MPYVPRFLYRLLGINAGAGTKMSVRSVLSARRGKHSIGRDCNINCTFSFDRPEAMITFGDRCYIGKSHLVAAEDISIGDDVTISWGVTIVDHNSHAIDWELRKNDIINWNDGKKDWAGIGIAPVRIGNKAWIGFNLIILKGVTLGEGAIVGAGSVVTKDVAPFMVVAGNPASPIKTRA